VTTAHITAITFLSYLIEQDCLPAWFSSQSSACR
jgi:hypothetical protein